jgi:hypothetical protein
MFIGFRSSAFWAVKPLEMDSFEPGEKLESQKMTKRKSHLALAMTVDVLAVD